MTWASEVWAHWREAAREANQSSPAALLGQDTEKWKAYEERLEHELDAAREEYRARPRSTPATPATPATPPTVTKLMIHPQCALADHVK